MSTTHRPDFIEPGSPSQASLLRLLRSPRLHVAGEAPPELSPLDAISLQTRLLARQLEESTKKGRRMSRLPPLTIESPVVVTGRSDYFRSMSQELELEQVEPPPLPNLGKAFRTEREENLDNRPMSVHPRMSRIPPTPDDSFPDLPPRNSLRLGRLTNETDEGNIFFAAGLRRAQSPKSMDSAILGDRMSDFRSVSRSASRSGSTSASRSGSQSETQGSFSQPPSLKALSLTDSPERSVRIDSFDPAGLVPPRTVFSKRSSSNMTSPLELTEDDGPNSITTSYYDHDHRKLSTSSSLTSPAYSSHQRSPSISSDTSALPRPVFNFSRPLSRADTPGPDQAGTPGLDTPARQASSDSHGSFILSDETACTPVSMTSETFTDFNDDGKAAPSYIYSKFSLPRGKMLQRSSMLRLEGSKAQYQFKNLAIQASSNVQTHPLHGEAPPSPPTRPVSADDSHSEYSSKLDCEGSGSTPQPPHKTKQASADGGTRRWALTSPGLDAGARGKTALSTDTSDSASTIKAARSQYSTNAPTMADMSADDHVTKAVVLHETGSLKESTYHLRHAAKQGHPTGMLLFALACRHGWGMRPNQHEGVQWLRKAAESASLEIAVDEDQAKAVGFVERKARKAQFALSIYELGVSHMNGWGIEQDKGLALRCFEIAGSWGDVDALAEAGFCYAQGIGCKRNLKKSAYFYRQAEAKGMSMVGNSWIHKSKYDGDGSSTQSEKGTRSKSKARKGLFGKMSSK